MYVNHVNLSNTETSTNHEDSSKEDSRWTWGWPRLAGSRRSPPSRASVVESNQVAARREPIKIAAKACKADVPKCFLGLGTFTCSTTERNIWKQLPWSLTKPAVQLFPPMSPRCWGTLPANTTYIQYTALLALALTFHLNQLDMLHHVAHPCENHPEGPSVAALLGAGHSPLELVPSPMPSSEAPFLPGGRQGQNLAVVVVN